jgi:hypothetical protein
MSPELKAAIAALAEQDRRSVSTYIEMVLEAHVKATSPKLLKPKRA